MRLPPITPVLKDRTECIMGAAICNHHLSLQKEQVMAAGVLGGDRGASTWNSISQSEVWCHSADSTLSVNGQPRSREGKVREKQPPTCLQGAGLGGGSWQCLHYRHL